MVAEPAVLRRAVDVCGPDVCIRALDSGDVSEERAGTPGATGARNGGVGTARDDGPPAGTALARRIRPAI
ncbi:hypothetical protein [Streptomonospora salina]|uniref:Uncharacterized protein n=1 Tax=Streptomonospora salina TaxID=104205 RepID=A0A841EDQ9_9ACTN|nr:hypothetical protein [Streptomonospora salina]